MSARIASISKLSTMRFLANLIDSRHLEAALVSERFVGSPQFLLLTSHVRRLGNGAPEHPPPPLPNPFIPISHTFVFTCIFALVAVFVCDAWHPPLHAVFFNAALERFRPLHFFFTRGCRIAVDGLESHCAASCFSLFEITPQEEHFLPQGIQSGGRFPKAKSLVSRF